jgi:protein-L-isoaspartate(D-aspartate) O-methyltransferase
MSSSVKLSYLFYIVVCLLFFATTGEAKKRDEIQDSLKYTGPRLAMVEDQIKTRGVSDSLVLAAMATVARHRFVPEEYRNQAYEDHPLPIGYDQTISQPYIVALMTELLHPDGSMKVLEVGTGSGYQAAILAEIVDTVVTIEIVPELVELSRRILAELDYGNIVRIKGDGYRGYPPGAPFDAIIVTCSPPEVPQPLLDQLALGGRMVIPVGEQSQTLLLITRTEEGYDRQEIIPVRFVPMTGEAQGP